MSKKREPLLSYHQIDLDAQEYAAEQNDCYANDYDGYWIGGKSVQEVYEAARAKDAELIQKLVDALDWYVKEDDVMEGGEWDEMNAPWIEGRNEAEKVLAAADAEGFKPTDQ